MIMIDVFLVMFILGRIVVKIRLMMIKFVKILDKSCRVIIRL